VGATKLLLAGGAQAVGAMAFGTASGLSAWDFPFGLRLHFLLWI
jgi:hypothetical protein